MKVKKSGYKYQIEQALLKHSWKIETIGSNEAWWDDEHWKISFEFDPSLSFYLCFIVDPMFEGPRKPGQGIYEIKASTTFPTNWNTGSKIASISMTKRKFEIKLDEFIADLEKYKKEKTMPNKD